MPETLNVYLHEDGAEQFIDDYESRHGELVAASTNYEQLAKSGQSLYAGVMSVAAVMIVILAGFMVLLVLYIIINSMIVQRRQEFGIYKAIGWSSAQLARHTALSLVPVIALASLVAAGAAYAFMPQVMGSIFSMVGAMRNHFEVPMIVLMACVVLLALMSFAMSMALMRPVKRIMVYSLLKE
ncbi:FtsX-like permease family protein [Bifidobacterium magnum]|uniref:FtsX-like permease family protein n=1 Tax=Bifidobacterium magnum TaxID=1692 RepID=UPI000406F09D|nr:ABC transporter permease [Bifidobacterium magnum]